MITELFFFASTLLTAVLEQEKVSTEIIHQGRGKFGTLPAILLLGKYSITRFTSSLWCKREEGPMDSEEKICMKERKEILYARTLHTWHICQ